MVDPKNAERCRAYRAAHREVLNAKDRAYYEAHRAERLVQTRAYQAAHRAELRSKQRAYYEAHRAERAEADRAYYRRNPIVSIDGEPVRVAADWPTEVRGLAFSILRARRIIRETR